MRVSQWDRRTVLRAAVAGAAGAALGLRPARAADPSTQPGPLFTALKYRMVKEPGSPVERFRMLKELGYDGVELSSPGGLDVKAALAASRKTGLSIPGVVDGIHWETRLSDPDPTVREKALGGLKTALRDAHRVGASSVLLVPGKVTDPKKENHEQVWKRSIAQIRKALPLAARLGVRILIENVWNGFCYDPNQFAEYIDEIASPWVGVHFDIGNHRKYGKPEEWIRILGERIVKLDAKDWSKDKGFCNIGAGAVNWPAVRRELAKLRFTGWVSAEVSGGKRDRLTEIHKRMRRHLLSAKAG